jgi:hypothetical protein
MVAATTFLIALTALTHEVDNLIREVAPDVVRV